MRRVNAVITVIILVLFLFHGVYGGFQLLGVGNTALKAVSWTAAVLIAVHTVIGIKLTVDTIKVQKKTGAGYFKENKLFWARRISGFAVMVLLLFHFTAFSFMRDGVYRLRQFDAGRLAAQILLVFALAVHIISNVRPMMISFGIKSLKQRSYDILIILSVLILFFTAAFIVYYLRWNIW